MMPVLLTLPDTPVTSGKGFAHLIIVAIILLASIIGIVVLAITGNTIPGVLESTTTLGAGYLIGVNLTSNKN